MEAPINCSGMRRYYLLHRVAIISWTVYSLFGDGVILRSGCFIRALIKEKVGDVPLLY